MIVCPNCSARQLDGTIFCAECGADMINAGPPESTRELNVGAIESHDPLPASGPLSANDSQSMHMVTLVVVRSRRRIEVDLSDEVLIGRADPARGIMPDVDLGPFGGYDAGVSRRHAILSYRDGTYRVEDLSSANGTFVNGRRIAPMCATPLQHGDEIMCGTLLLRLEVRNRQR
ncbi:MAG: FHA domain-containing protein [Roseiflexus sp.]|nr:FHA domain-containing protein [Roseiflexus sp.]MCS7290506.1 FHA domain-containing protein [Roseiflexus sp.]MDW8232287.1 FHA domain-containing protein [Roseiflexaceae bacterium]